jgi:uncharacterized protein YkwD
VVKNRMRRADTTPVKVRVALTSAVAVLVGVVGLVLPAGAGDNDPLVETAALATGLRQAERLDPPDPPPAPQAAPAPATTVSQEILALVNAERSRRGLGPMVLDSRLQRTAQAHSEDQANRQTMSHTGGDGSTLRVRMDRSGFPWRTAAENVAYGYPTPASVMVGWMNSSGHRANILSSNTHLGVGLAYSSTGVPYWTQVFATPR